MIVAAPLIVGSIFVIKNVAITPKISVKIDSVSATEDKEIIPDAVSGLIPFIKQRLPSWLKAVISIIISIIFLNYIYKYTGLNEGNNIKSILLSNLVLVKLFFILGSISSSIMIGYYILNIYFFIMFSREKINRNIYLPQFILDWLKFIQKISKYENKGLYIEFYFRLILVYIFILLLTLFTLNNLAIL